MTSDVRCCLLLSIAVLTCSGLQAAEQGDAKPLVLVVMDPLAKPLSCPCVAGYAQRDYEKLGAALEKSLGREVRVLFNESLAAALKQGQVDHADLVIGKQSVVLHDAHSAKLSLRQIAMLTAKDGSTTQRGLLVVPTDDPAKSAADLQGYRIYFGPAECDEKHTAALQLLKEQGVTPPAKLETAVACDEGATTILELAPKGIRACAVISSYAKPLLEGCGQVPKGALRVIGETADVPFVAAFVTAKLDAKIQEQLTSALLKSTSNDVVLRIALETKRGFVAVEHNDAGDAVPADVAKKK